MLDLVEEDDHHPRQEAVDDEAGRVVHEHRPLAEPVGDRPRGREGSVVGLGVLISSTSGISATGLKKCMPSSRSGCSSPSAIAVTESAEVFVASTHSAGTTSSSSRKTCRLTSSSSKIASIAKSQSSKPSYEVVPFASAASETASCGSSRPVRRRREVVADRLERAVDDLLLEVAQDDRHAEPAEEERRELRRHQPGARDADLGHLARLREGAAGPATSSALDEVERVERRLRLGVKSRSASASSSAR